MGKKTETAKKVAQAIVKVATVVVAVAAAVTSAKNTQGGGK